MARGRSSGWRSSRAHYAQPAARPLPEDSRDGRPWRARRGSRPRLRWPGQRRGRWRPRLARRHPWLGRQPDATCPPAPPPRPARRSLLLAGLIGSCVGRSRALLGPPLAGANGAPARAGQGPCPTHPERLGSPPFPPPGGLVGLRPAIEAIPGARPGRCVRRCVGTLPPPVAKLRSCVATLRSLRRPRPPALLSPRPRLAVPLPAGSGLVGSARGIARPASRSRECRPWRAGILPGVPPAPSMARGHGSRFDGAL